MGRELNRLLNKKLKCRSFEKDAFQMMSKTKYGIMNKAIAKESGKNKLQILNKEYDVDELMQLKIDDDINYSINVFPFIMSVLISTLDLAFTYDSNLQSKLDVSLTDIHENIDKYIRRYLDNNSDESGVPKLFDKYPLYLYFSFIPHRFSLGVVEDAAEEKLLQFMLPHLVVGKENIIIASYINLLINTYITADTYKTEESARKEAEQTYKFNKDVDYLSKIRTAITFKWSGKILRMIYSESAINNNNRLKNYLITCDIYSRRLKSMFKRGSALKKFMTGQLSLSDASVLYTKKYKTRPSDYVYNLYADYRLSKLKDSDKGTGRIKTIDIEVNKDRLDDYKKICGEFTYTNGTFYRLLSKCKSVRDCISEFIDSDIKEEVESLKDVIESKDKSISKLNEQSVGYNNRIRKLEKENKELNKSVKKVNNSVESVNKLKDKVDTLNSKLSDKDKEIKRLNYENKEANDEINNLKGEIDKLKKIIEGYKSKEDSLKGKNDNLKGDKNEYEKSEIKSEDLSTVDDKDIGIKEKVDYISKYKLLICGGFDVIKRNFESKYGLKILQATFDDWNDADKRFDYAIILSTNCTHKQAWYVEKAAERNKANTIFSSSTNLEYIVNLIYDKILLEEKQ